MNNFPRLEQAVEFIDNQHFDLSACCQLENYRFLSLPDELRRAAGTLESDLRAIEPTEEPRGILHKEQVFVYAMQRYGFTRFEAADVVATMAYSRIARGLSQYPFCAGKQEIKLPHQVR